MRAPSALRFWAWPWELRRRGVLGINARNLNLLFELNPRTYYPRVDDKVITKSFCARHRIPTPHTYAVIDMLGDVRRFERTVEGREEFVVKPARGAAGRGVLVIVANGGGLYRTASGDPITASEMRHHLSTIISGLYSLGGRPDRVLVEELVRRHDALEPIAVCGTPDIRVIVHRGTPIMSMLRLPTRASRGRANLHQGAVGVGIDLGTGRTVGGVHHNRIVEAHPDTGARVAGIQIPHWDQVLDISARLAAALGMGYVGVDVVLDARRGPVVLEANARPGLAVQIANRTGILVAITRSRSATHPPRRS